MGRVTIFALTECPHCKRAKAALTSRGIPYKEINLSTHPDKRTDMIALAEQFTVPQIFFNDKHVGGADDTIALLEKWDRETHLYPTALERYKKEVESQTGPTDPRLALPTNPPVRVDKLPLPRNQEDAVPLPNGKQTSVLEITRTLVDTLPRKDMKYMGKIYKNSFKGSEGVTSLMKYYDPVEDKEKAIDFGKMLQERKILHHVCGQHEFGDNDYFFRLQPYHTPRSINTFRIWTDRIDPDYMSLLEWLTKLMGEIESKAMDDNGFVDCLSAEDDPNFWIFEEAVCELQGVDMASMDDRTKLAFGINLYNLMIKHAFIKVGTPSTDLQRLAFFNNVSYNVGGDVLSFSELENGILRSNSRPPYQLCKPFSSSDPRRRLILSKVDPRIHFALNCGAKSCPPVKEFTAIAIEEELRIVAIAFCEQDDNVLVDEEKYELHLTQIMNWYRPDFAESIQKLPMQVVSYLRGDKKERLQRMIDNSSKGIKVKFVPYDWSNNASKSKTFKPSSLNPDEISMNALFSF